MEESWRFLREYPGTTEHLKLTNEFSEATPPYFAQGRIESIHHHCGNPFFFSFSGSEASMVYTLLSGPMCIPFPLLSQENGIHHSFFGSVTLGSGNRPRKEGCHGGGVYSFFKFLVVRQPRSPCGLSNSGLPNANARSLSFSYAISQIAPLPLVIAQNRSFKSQIAARYAAFWHAIPQIALASFLSCL